MPLNFSFLSTRPVVKVTAQIVTSKSPWLTHLFTLGSYSRTVIIDSRTNTVRIRVRYLWAFWKLHTVAFNKVEYVTYEMLDHSIGSSFTGERGGAEQFEVGLGLVTGERVDLCKFIGEGEFASDHAFFWEWFDHFFKEATDVVGTQQEESMNFVDLICYRIGAPLGP